MHVRGSFFPITFALICVLIALFVDLIVMLLCYGFFCIFIINFFTLLKFLTLLYNTLLLRLFSNLKSNVAVLHQLFLLYLFNIFSFHTSAFFNTLTKHIHVAFFLVFCVRLSLSFCFLF